MPTIKAKIWIRVVPAIQKELMMTLFNCRGTFEINTLKHTFFIWDVCFFNLDDSGDNGIYRIQVYTDNNTKDIFIDKLNVLEFTLHFL